jgi:hypothetical protein
MACTMVRHSIVLCLIALSTACSSDTTGDGATDFSKLTLKDFPGFGPPGSGECELQTEPRSYTVTASTRELEYRVCELLSPVSSTVLREGKRELSESEFASVKSAYAEVRPSTKKSCGEDADVITLDVESSRGTQALVDDFYSDCPGTLHEGRTFVSGLNELAAVLYDAEK